MEKTKIDKQKQKTKWKMNNKIKTISENVRK